MPELALVDKRRLARGLAQAARPQAAAPREVPSLTYADVATEGRRHDACRDGVSTGGYLDGLGARPRGPGVNKPEKRAQLGRKRSGMGGRPTASFVSAGGRRAVVNVSVSFSDGPDSAAASPSTLPSKAAASPPEQPMAVAQPKPTAKRKPKSKTERQSKTPSHTTGSSNVSAQGYGIGKMLLLAGMLLVAALAVR